MEPRIGTAALADPKAKHFLRKPTRSWRASSTPIWISVRGLGWTSCRHWTRSARLSSRFWASSFRSRQRERSCHGSWRTSGAAALTGGAAGRRCAGASWQRHVGTEGRDVAGYRRAVCGRASPRGGVGRDDRRRGRGRTDQRTWSRAMDGARIPADSAQPARRVPTWRRCTAARGPASVRFGPRPDGSWS
jgi:hypothetical protein